MNLARKQTVAVIGAGGHVGFGLTLCIVEGGYHTYGVDINEAVVKSISAGQVPFVEEGAEEMLARVLQSDRLTMTTDISVVRECDVVVIVMGTPIDENLNPIMMPLIQLFDSLKPYLHRGQLLVLRSTVSPGTTDNIRALVEKTTGLMVSEDIALVFAPERVVQGKSLLEIPSLPQLIGAYDETDFRRAEEFFRAFVRNKCIRLTPVEAELAKLMCNMARYTSFALANEFSLITDEYNSNVHRILDACSYDYPRFRVPSPGPNVSGPCLFKDGFFLTERLPFPELILTGFKINESMPAHIFKKIKKQTGVYKVAILGLAFKAGSDDTRYSLSYKLKKLLASAGYEVVAVDPNVKEHSDFSVLAGSDCVVLMTPHQEFRDLTQLNDFVKKETCLYVDLWGFWPETRERSQNGCFHGWEIRRSSPQREGKERVSVVLEVLERGQSETPHYRE
jgi:UDP-N-acetyl-D-mannosaminuronic acid dehydrogenase